jgi:small-conductance mechanosensitive channel
MTTPSPADAPPDLVAPIKTVQEAATDFSTDFISWIEKSTTHALMILGGIIAAIIFLQLLRRGLIRLLGGKTGKPVNVVRLLAYRLVRNTSVIFLSVLGFRLAFEFVKLPKGVLSGVTLAFTITLVIQIALWVREVILVLIERRLIKQGKLGDDAPVTSALGVIGWLVNVGIWSIALLLLLDNLGVNITALVAGLGIGGLAIGLAAQGIMADLFSALSIVFDKPFVRGDFIAFGDKKGTVERIGLKTSRIRALTGEMIVVANNQLLTTVIHNHQQLQQRRMVFMTGVTYATSADKLEKIPGLIKAAIDAQPLCRFDRSHLMNLGPSSIDFETVYFFSDKEYIPHMDAYQAILLQIIRSFAAEGIEFAYPTQTVYLARTKAAQG